ncbi:hypothetical protein H6F86_15100 [Phormidium sp. FACHB-592]|uniref:Alpha/beta hydrolase n=1 Tax=Stenomitos frigidus AS-A4 TaxID=2933935 RepID=A0ABV0KS40_9CYAN|nr:hypothetical protein [Phormidium sp. FACHB-592]MBD2075198.1 hypothetical protein [Phormidium sp. FACHB-592]
MSAKRHRVRVVVCPGIHERALTQQFIEGLLTTGEERLHPASWLVFPTDRYPAYSGLHILRFLHEKLSTHSPDAALHTPLILIGFSAGVVGAVSAACGWRSLGGVVKALIAIDGWGVPLIGDFPMHRMSHDAFTHWSSALLGAGEDSFYADPSVDHLDLWRSPQIAAGYWVKPGSSSPPRGTSAATFLTALLCDYEALL